MWPRPKQWAYRRLIMRFAASAVRQGRIADAGGDPPFEELRDAGEAAELLRQAFLGDGPYARDEFDLDVAETAALVHWYRWKYLPEGMPEEIRAALSLFRQIHDVAPERVPAALRFLFDPADAWNATEDDLRLIANAARDLLRGDEDDVRGSLDEARSLVTQARRLVRRLAPRDPYARAAVAAALVEALPHFDDPALLTDAEELASSFEATALRDLLGDRAEGPLPHQRELLIRWSPSWPGHAPAVDLRLVEVLADVRWQSYLSTDDAPGVDLAYLVALFREIHETDPELVPNGLRRLFDPAFALDSDYEADVSLFAVLASDLFEYAESVGQGTPSLDQAITLAEESLRLGAPLPLLGPRTRTVRAWALHSGFEYTRRRPLIDTALADAREALAHTAPDSDQWLGRVAALGTVLVELADTDGDRSAHRQALGLLRTAIATADRLDPVFPLVTAILLRAVQLRLTGDVSPAVAAEVADELGELTRLVPGSFPGRDLMALTVLLADWTRLVPEGDFAGLREITKSLDEIVVRLPAGTRFPDLVRMIIVTTDVLERALEPGSSERLDRSLARYREVRAACTALEPGDGYDDHRQLLALLFTHAHLAGRPELSAPLIPLLTADLARAEPGSAHESAIGAALGAALIQRFQWTGERSDLDRGTALVRRRQHDLEASGPSADEMIELRGYLSEALKWNYLTTGDEDTYEEAISVFRAIGTDPSQPVYAGTEASIGGDFAATAGHWHDAVELFGHAIEHAGTVARRRMARADHERLLVLMRRAVAGAAHAALRLGDPVRAVESLERGRAVLFHQRLDAQDDLTRLRAERPGLADRIEHLQAAIDRTSAVDHRRDLNRQLTRMLAEVRARPGFERFLAAPTYRGLRPAEGQTVVLVNHSDFGSHALVTTAEEVRAVPLPLLGPDVATKVSAFQQAVNARFRAPTRRERLAGGRAILDTIAWLRQAIVRPVLDAIGPDRAWPRIHWCPTGSLSLFPLHAAALDQVVSSYTPSLRVLARATAQPAPPREARSLLVVSLPGAPGLTTLPGARQEADHLAGVLPDTRILSGDQATHETVRHALGTHAWVHFACHAAHDLTSPSRSRLFLHDHETAPLTVEEISGLRLTHARFAYLSACDTARGGLNLPDEALHLGGALQLAGYQHVIASLWPVHDAIATQVTKQVYARISDGSALDPAASATALHRAVRALRDHYPDDPAVWAGYVHFGP
jgi:hypothetical protein